MSRFCPATEERGFPPYHPVLMTKLIVYGYVRGMRSSRKMQSACLEDVAFRILAAGQAPDFRTIATFRARHLEVLEGAFAQVLHLCREAGLVKLGHVAVDSTKVRANASKHKAMSFARMQEEEKKLRSEIRSWFEECAEVDAAEDEFYGIDKTGDELPAELADPRRRLQKIQEAKAALEAEAQATGEEEPKPKAPRNFTDPDSRIMLSSDKAFIQAYNCHAAVDADSQVILLAQVSQTAADQGQLLPLVEQVTLDQGVAPQMVSADAGYWKEADVERLEINDIEPFVAPKQLQAILGDGVVGLSAHNVVRLKQVWEQEFQAWSKRGLHGKRYVYLWADSCRVIRWGCSGAGRGSRRRHAGMVQSVSAWDRVGMNLPSVHLGTGGRRRKTQSPGNDDQRFKDRGRESKS